MEWPNRESQDGVCDSLFFLEERCGPTAGRENIMKETCRLCGKTQPELFGLPAVACDCSGAEAGAVARESERSGDSLRKIRELVDDVERYMDPCNVRCNKLLDDIREICSREN
jgi:hypothetical protein